MTSSAPIVLVVSDDSSQRRRLQGQVEAAGMQAVAASSGAEALGHFFKLVPNCLLLRHGMTMSNGRDLALEVKSDSVYRHLPVLVEVSPEAVAEGVDWNVSIADDYLMEGCPAHEFVSRIRLALARAQRDVNANPLTGLPGNLTITREAERRLAFGTPFAFAYFDIDGFKPYNDKYGFARGDEVLRMTARLVANTVRALDHEEGYVGHIGGDDFVFIVPPSAVPLVCPAIVRHFDQIVPGFYDDVDRQRGLIESCDRQGNVVAHPLMSCSIAVVDTSGSEMKHIGELYARVTELKTFAKRMEGSNYIVDRRK